MLSHLTFLFPLQDKIEQVILVGGATEEAGCGVGVALSFFSRGCSPPECVLREGRDVSRQEAVSSRAGGKLGGFP